jgi:hypothetical protein
MGILYGRKKLGRPREMAALGHVELYYLYSK